MTKEYSRRSIGLIAIVMVALANPVYAWGPVGHATVADIAQAHLTPAAAAEVHRLLATEGKQQMAQIASWADTIRKDESHPNRPDHSVRLDLDGGVTPDHPCPRHFCADEGIDFWSKVLADPKRSDEDRETALKYLVHLVGDMQQPLHGVDATGADNKVIFDGTETNLHGVWDGGILRSRGEDNPEDLARKLMATEKNVPDGGTVLDWANEDREIARTQIYDTITPHTKEVVTLPPDYASEKLPIVEMRLMQGGLRLARLLNSLLK